jgi:hypothetical protein
MDMTTNYLNIMNLLRSRLYTLAIAAGLLLAACHEDEELTIPVVPSYTDPEVALADFRQQLVAATNGWEATLRPQPGKMYTLFLTLDGSEVTMYSDADTIVAQTPTRTGYTIALNQEVNPSIAFANESVLDRIPGGGKNTGVDVSYSYNFTRNDTVFLTGNRYGDVLRLVRASAETRAAYEGRQLRKAMKSVTQYLSGVRYLYFRPSEDILIQFAVNRETRGIYVTYLYQGVKFFGSDYAYALDGIHLKNPLRVAGHALQALTWDAVAGKLTTIYGDTRYDLQEATVPIIPLHYLLGEDYSPSMVFLTPSVQALPGWSAKFYSLWATDENAMFKDAYYFHYVAANLALDTQTMELYVNYINPAGDYVRGIFLYTFTKTDEGVFDFTPAGVPDGEAGKAAKDIDPYIPNILRVFSDNSFRIEFYDAYASLGGVIPQFVSVDDPTLYFAGLWFTP